MTAEAIVRKGRKFDQVVAGAQTVFMRDGFEGASVDDIAREAGVSKATLYSYFPDKRLLFLEVASAQCRQQADEALMSIDMSRPPEEVLSQIGNRILCFMLSDLGQQTFRICVAEADRFPELGRQFFQCGPMVAHKALTGYFEVAQARGELNIEDMALAGHQFAELCKTDLFPTTVFGLRDKTTEAERAHIVTEAVTTFMARYGTRR